MTKAQGDSLTGKMHDMEGEVAKLQRVRQDLEILLDGQVKDLFERVATFETQMSALKHAIAAEAEENSRLALEIQKLRGEMEESHNSSAVAQYSASSSASINKSRIIPDDQKEHFAHALKTLASGKHHDGIFLLEEYIKLYPSDTENVAKGQYELGETYRKLSETAANKDEKSRQLKRAVVSYQKIIEIKKSGDLREEALYKIGLSLKELGNTDGSKAALKELISLNKNGKRGKEAQKLLVE